MRFWKHLTCLARREIAIEESIKKDNSREIEKYFSRKKGIIVPIDVILETSKYLKFKDFKNFVKALWPKGDEDMLVRRRLFIMSTHEVETMFLNMKTLEVEFNYDPDRDEGDKWLVNWHSLSPVFGGIKLQLEEEFASLSELRDAVKNQVHFLNSCENYRHASCLCHLRRDDRYSVRPSLSECKYGHFHHFCSQHVISWLEKFLPIAMEEQVSGAFTYTGMNERFLKFLAGRYLPQKEKGNSGRSFCEAFSRRRRNCVTPTE